VFRPSCKEDFTGNLTNLNLIKPVKIIIDEEDIDAKNKNPKGAILKKQTSYNSSIENLQKAESSTDRLIREE
jgi:hypothetical protein